MFAKSAASDTLQGRAIQRVNERWGDDFLNRAGRETIGIPVCKKKYTPFRINDGQVERMFGCKSHHMIRKKVIEKHGLRTGWEPFGQWSMKKAKSAARKQDSAPSSDASDDDSTSSIENKATVCGNGECVWSKKTAYDDIYKELTGVSEEDD